MSDREESLENSSYEEEETEELVANVGLPSVFMDHKEEIDIILACRVKKADEEIYSDDETCDQVEGKKTTEEEIIEYLCKYKNKSYLHCKWISELDDDIQIRNKINRFNKQFNIKLFEGRIQEYFNPEFTIVERIIDHGVCNDSEVYFVKWKGLSYGESTWEFESNIDDKEKIEQYKRISLLPTQEERRIPSRPAPHKFNKLESPPLFRNGNQLREFQLEGLNWLIYCWYQRRNSILADEMGLGKTIQTIAILEYLRTFEHIRGPFIVIAPLATVKNWKREFEKWTDMNVLVFHGNTQSREVMKNHEFFHKNPNSGKLIYPKLCKFNVLVTTYELAIAESYHLSKIPWQYLVVDEGHSRLKTHNSKLALTLKNFNASHKLILTGTPIQNNLTELFSLLQFLDAETFYDLDVFLEEYGNLGESGFEKLEHLHKLISPYILRRLQQDVVMSIPPKEETCH